MMFDQFRQTRSANISSMTLSYSERTGYRKTASIDRIVSSAQIIERNSGPEIYLLFYLQENYILLFV